MRSGASKRNWDVKEQKSKKVRKRRRKLVAKRKKKGLKRLLEDGRRGKGKIEKKNAKV